MTRRRLAVALAEVLATGAVLLAAVVLVIHAAPYDEARDVDIRIRIHPEESPQP